MVQVWLPHPGPKMACHPAAHGLFTHNHFLPSLNFTSSDSISFCLTFSRLRVLDTFMIGQLVIYLYFNSESISEIKLQAGPIPGDCDYSELRTAFLSHGQTCHLFIQNNQAWLERNQEKFGSRQVFVNIMSFSDSHLVKHAPP